MFLFGMRAITLVAMLSLVFGSVEQARGAIPLTEDFEAPFPAWESAWLGVNSNLENYYGQGADRGNNPDGLWISDGDGVFEGDPSVDIVFDPLFGATLMSFAIDVAGYVPTTLRVFDMSSNVLLDVPVTLTSGAYTDPGTYASYSVNSNNGISGFSFIWDGSSPVEGWTSIDNVSVTIPEPATICMLGLGALSLVIRKK
jgi:hypothetical protein